MNTIIWQWAKLIVASSVISYLRYFGDKQKVLEKQQKLLSIVNINWIVLQIIGLILCLIN